MATNGGTALRSLDVGNIMALEHVNVCIPDQRLGTYFYVMALGGTRDPYMMAVDENMWINFGNQQFHLPNRGTHVIPGHIGLVLDDLGALRGRLAQAEKPLAKTKFAWAGSKGHVDVTCPWGNHFRAHAPSAAFGDMSIGVPYVEFLVKRGAAARIGKFYERVLQAPWSLRRSKDGVAARISVGASQALVFRETDERLPLEHPYHVAVYIANFSAPHAELQARELVSRPFNANPMMRNSSFQYNFKGIVDVDTGEMLHPLEHEVRSIRHPMYQRPMVNRNQWQSLGNYVRGADAAPALPW